MRSVIFADIDGVLHPNDAARMELSGDTWQAVGEQLFIWVPLLWQIIEPHEVGIVIHSTWRYSYALDELRDFFPEAIRGRILAVTERGARHESIVQYVETHGVEDYIVLDDMPQEFPLAWNRLVVCDGKEGVADESVQACIRQFLENAIR
jgi:hypothetical protein